MERKTYNDELRNREAVETTLKENMDLFGEPVCGGGGGEDEENGEKNKKSKRKNTKMKEQKEEPTKPKRNIKSNTSYTATATTASTATILEHNTELRKQRITLDNKMVKPKNPSQDTYVNMLNCKENKIIFAIGPAGDGKNPFRHPTRNETFFIGELQKNRFHPPSRWMKILDLFQVPLKTNCLHG
jgi:hypothetical protein